MIHDSTGFARKTKVVQVIADSAIGGGTKHVLEMVRNFDKALFSVFLVCPKGHLANEAKKISGVNVSEFDFGSKISLGSILRLNKLLHSLRAGDDPFGPMVVHSHGSKANILVGLYRIAGVRYVYTEHLFVEGMHLKSWTSEWLQRKLLARVNRHNNLIIAVSPAVKKYLVSSGLAPAKRIAVVPNGIDLRGIKHLKHDDRQTGVIGTIGSLNHLKGHRFLIQAFAEVLKVHPNYKLEIVGDGPELQNINSQISNLKTENNIIVLGAKKNIDEYLEHWDAFVLPSLAETFGLVVLEAWAAGTPVIASRVGGLADLIEDNESGILVKPHDSADLAKAINKLIDSPKLGEHLSQKARTRLSYFDIQKVVKKIEELYLELIG